MDSADALTNLYKQHSTTGKYAEDLTNCIDFLRWLTEMRETDTEIEVTDNANRFESKQIPYRGEFLRNACKWLLQTLNKRRRDVGISDDLQDGYLTNHNRIEPLLKRFTAKCKELKEELCEEADSKFDFKLEVDHEMQIADLVLQGHTNIHRTDKLQRLNSGVFFRGALAHMNRAMNWRAFTFNHMMFDYYSSNDYEQRNLFKSRKGNEYDDGWGISFKNCEWKGDSSSPPKITSCLPHSNPLLCFLTLLGITFFYRFLVEQEDFFNVENAKSYCHKRLLLGSLDAGNRRPLSTSVQTNSFKNNLKAANIEFEEGMPVCHMTRTHSQIRAKSSDGIEKWMINDQCHYDENTSDRSYLQGAPTPLPLQRQCAALDAKGDCYKPEHVRCIDEKPEAFDALIDDIGQYFKDGNNLKVQESLFESKTAEWDTDKSTNKERERKIFKLHLLKRMIPAIRHILRLSIAGFASRAKDKDGNFVGEALHMRYANAFYIREMPQLFRNAIFHQICQLIQQDFSLPKRLSDLDREKLELEIRNQKKKQRVDLADHMIRCRNPNCSLPGCQKIQDEVEEEMMAIPPGTDMDIFDLFYSKTAGVEFDESASSSSGSSKDIAKVVSPCLRQIADAMMESIAKPMSGHAMASVILDKWKNIQVDDPNMQTCMQQLIDYAATIMPTDLSKGHMGEDVTVKERGEVDIPGLAHFKAGCEISQMMSLWHGTFKELELKRIANEGSNKKRKLGDDSGSWRLNKQYCNKDGKLAADPRKQRWSQLSSFLALVQHFKNDGEDEETAIQSLQDMVDESSLSGLLQKMEIKRILEVKKKEKLMAQLLM